MYAVEVPALHPMAVGLHLLLLNHKHLKPLRNLPPHLAQVTQADPPPHLIQVLPVDHQLPLQGHHQELPNNHQMLLVQLWEQDALRVVQQDAFPTVALLQTDHPTVREHAARVRFSGVTGMEIPAHRVHRKK